MGQRILFRCCGPTIFSSVTVLDKIFQHVRFRITPTVLIEQSRKFADSRTMMWSSAYYLEATLRLFLAELKSIVRRASCSDFKTSIQASFSMKL